jgi:hypothetical protein
VTVLTIEITEADHIQGIPGGKVNILELSVILNKSVYVHVSYSERFPRYSYFTVQFYKIVDKLNNNKLRGFESIPIERLPPVSEASANFSG